MTQFVVPWELTEQEKAHVIGTLRCVSAEPPTQAQIDSALDHARGIKQLVSVKPEGFGVDDGSYAGRRCYWD